VGVLGVGEGGIGEFLEGLVHRIERVDGRGELAEFHDLMELLGQRSAVERVGGATHDQLPHGHAVHGEGAGLVDADNGRRAEGLDHRGAPGEHVLLRQPPRPQREEDRQHDRELLGKHRHRGGYSREDAFEPDAPGEAVDHGDGNRGEQSRHGDDPHQAIDFSLERGSFLFDCSQRGADSTQLGIRRGALHQGDRPALDHERSREHPRGRVTARRAHRFGRGVGADGRLAHRNGFAGEGGLVERDVDALDEHRIGGNPITLHEQHDVTSHDVAAGDAYLCAVADDERPGRRKVTKGRQGVLGLVLLVDRDSDDDEHEGQEDRAVEGLGKHEIHGAGSEEE
jgi:hypothetical protein